MTERYRETVSYRQIEVNIPRHRNKQTDRERKTETDRLIEGAEADTPSERKSEIDRGRQRQTDANRKSQKYPATGRGREVEKRNRGKQ